MASGDTFYFHRAGKLHFFCPLCHYHQSTNTIAKVTAKHHVQLAVATIATTMLAWPLFGWKGFSLHFFYWLSFEFFYRLRKRHALICQSCGFDPFLYRQDVFRARAALKEHWRNRIEKEGLFAGIKLKNYQTKDPSAGQSVEVPPEIADVESTKNNPGAAARAP
jgi:hypothetical protein